MTEALALCIGISEYADSAWPALVASGEEVSKVGEALGSAGFTVLPPLAGPVTKAAVERRIAELKVPSSGRLLVYWTGHGDSTAAGSRLVTNDDTMAPDELAGLLESVPGATQIVLILDCCASGSAAVDIAQAINLRHRDRPAGRRRPAVISLIAATFGPESVSQLQFADAVAAALTSGSPGLPWPSQLAEVTPQEFATAADDWMRRSGESENRARSIGIEAGTPFFPNPLFSPYAGDIRIGDTATVRRDGVLTAVQSWRLHSSHGLALISGAMGTGKTTVMRQLGAGAFGPVRTYAADLAPGRDLNHLVRLLGESFPSRPVAPSDVVAAVAAAGEPTVVLVDSLDEAVAADRMPILTQLLIPLAATPGVHVVVAARRSVDDPVMTALGAAAGRAVDLDADQEAHGQIARHVLRVLTTTAGSPYLSDRPLAERVAGELADRSAGVFLFADRVAMTLARESRALDVGSPEFQGVLRSGINGAIERDLAHLSDDPGRLLDVLTPLAWAAGNGLPRTAVWSALANALTDRPGEITTDDIGRVLTVAGSFVLAEVEQSRVVYRLRHQAYGNFLRTRSPIDPLTVQRRIMQALRRPAGQWAHADPYVLRHLAEHADAAGRLDELVADEDYLVHAESRILLPIASSTVRDRISGSLEVYLRAGPLMHDCSPRARAFTLDTLGGRWRNAASRQPYGVRPIARAVWTTAGAPSAHRLMRIGPEAIEALAVSYAGDRPVLAAAVGRDEFYRFRDGGGSIELWDPQTATLLQTLRRKHRSPVSGLAAVPVAGDTVLVVAYEDNVLEGWSFARREQMWFVDTEDFILRITAQRSRGSHILLTIGHDGAVSLWDAQRGRLLHAVRPTSGGAVFAVPFSAGGADRVAFGTNTGMLEFYDADTFAPLGVIQPDAVWTAGTATTLRGRPVLIGARDDGHLEIRDAADGRVLAMSRDEIDEISESLRAVEARTGDPFAIQAVGNDVAIWSLDPPQVTMYRRGHLDQVTGLDVIADAAGVRTLTTGGQDGTIRVWAGGGAGGGYSMNERYRRDTFDGSLGDPVYLPGSQPAVLAEDLVAHRLINASDGTLRFSAPRRHQTTADPQEAHQSITGVAQLSGGPMLLTYHDGARQHMWDLNSGRQYALPVGPYRYHQVQRVVAPRDGNSPALVIGDGEAPVSAYDFTGRRLCVLPDSDGAVPVMPAPFAAAGAVLIRRDDRITLHELATGALLGGFEVEPFQPRQGKARPLAVLAHPGERLWSVVISTPEGQVYLRHLGAGTDVRHDLGLRADVAAACSYDGVPLLALGSRNRLVLVDPRTGTVLESIPLESRVGGLTGGADREVIVRVGGVLRMIAIDLGDA
jgi:WD40 repeat protein